MKQSRRMRQSQNGVFSRILEPQASSPGMSSEKRRYWTDKRSSLRSSSRQAWNWGNEEPWVGGSPGHTQVLSQSPLSAIQLSTLQPYSNEICWSIRQLLEERNILSKTDAEYAGVPRASRCLQGTPRALPSIFPCSGGQPGAQTSTHRRVLLCVPSLGVFPIAPLGADISYLFARVPMSPANQTLLTECRLGVTLVAARLTAATIWVQLNPEFLSADPPGTPA